MTLADWNPTRRTWDTPAAASCGHAVPYTDPWPTGGAMRSGRVRRVELRHASVPALLPTPLVSDIDAGRRPGRRQNLRLTVEDAAAVELDAPHRRAYLPTPRVSDANGPHERRTGGPDLRTVIARVTAPLLPTPLTSDAKDGSLARRNPQLREAVARPEWGKYAPALVAWADLTRPAPSPTRPGRDDRPRLSPQAAAPITGVPAR